MKLIGANELKKTLAALAKTGAKRANRKAVRAGTTVLAKAFRSEVPEDEGDTKRATGSKVSKGKGGSITGMAGADVSKLEALESAGSVPSNIDWLLTYGHVAPNGVFVPPNDYVERAQAKGNAPALAAYTKKLAEEIEREAGK